MKLKWVVLTVIECVHFLCHWNSGTCSCLFSLFLLSDKADSIEISIFITKSHQSPSSCDACGMWKPLADRGNWPEDFCCPSQILTKQYYSSYTGQLYWKLLIVLIVRIWAYMHLCCWFVHLSSCSQLCPPSISTGQECTTAWAICFQQCGFYVSHSPLSRYSNDGLFSVNIQSEGQIN